MVGAHPVAPTPTTAGILFPATTAAVAAIPQHRGCTTSTAIVSQPAERLDWVPP